jgi:hypothetical protein
MVLLCAATLKPHATLSPVGEGGVFLTLLKKLALFLQELKEKNYICYYQLFCRYEK